VFACVFAGALFGMFLSSILPKEHLSENAKDVIKVTMAMIATLAALVLGLVNALIRPLLVLLTLPVTVLTLGLFIFVINGLLFWAVGSFVTGFDVGGFWSGVIGAIIFSVISWLLSALVLR